MGNPGVCLTCQHARWDRTASGRLHPSGEGRCWYTIPPMPEIPAAFYWSTLSHTSPSAYGGSISRKHGFETCPCYAPKGGPA